MKLPLAAIVLTVFAAPTLAAPPQAPAFFAFSDFSMVYPAGQVHMTQYMVLSNRADCETALAGIQAGYAQAQQKKGPDAPAIKQHQASCLTELPGELNNTQSGRPLREAYYVTKSVSIGKANVVSVDILYPVEGLNDPAEYCRRMLSTLSAKFPDAKCVAPKK